MNILTISSFILLLGFLVNANTSKKIEDTKPGYSDSKGQTSEVSSMSQTYLNLRSRRQNPQSENKPQSALPKSGQTNPSQTKSGGGTGSKADTGPKQERPKNNPSNNEGTGVNRGGKGSGGTNVNKPQQAPPKSGQTNPSDTKSGGSSGIKADAGPKQERPKENQGPKQERPKENPSNSEGTSGKGGGKGSGGTNTNKAQPDPPKPGQRNPSVTKGGGSPGTKANAGPKQERPKENQGPKQEKPNENPSHNEGTSGNEGGKSSGGTNAPIEPDEKNPKDGSASNQPKGTNVENTPKSNSIADETISKNDDSLTKIPNESDTGVSVDVPPNTVSKTGELTDVTSSTLNQKINSEPTVSGSSPSDKRKSGPSWTYLIIIAIMLAFAVAICMVAFSANIPSGLSSS